MQNTQHKMSFSWDTYIGLRGDSVSVDKYRNVVGNIFIILTMPPIMIVALFFECIIDICEWILEMIDIISDKIKLVAYKIKGFN